MIGRREGGEGLSFPNLVAAAPLMGWAELWVRDQEAPSQ